MEDRKRRLALNEAVFREVNERIEGLAESFQLTSEGLDLVCECADASCTQRISMKADEYEALRSNPTHFAVYPGHEIADVEDIVERCGAYDVVRKHPGPEAEIARDTSPRDS